MAGMYTTDGIVLRAIKYGETSMICDIFTEVHGLRSYIAGSVRNKKNAGKANLFYPGNIVQIVAYPSKEDKLARLKEIHYAYRYQHINLDVVITAVSTFMMEMIRKSIKEKEPNPVLFHFLMKSLIGLDSNRVKLSVYYMKFLIELTQYLGFAPMDNWEGLDYCFSLEDGDFLSEMDTRNTTLSTRQSELMHYFISMDSVALQNVEMSNSDRDKLTDNIILFYKYHIPSFGKVNSLEVLRTIL